LAEIIMRKTPVASTQTTANTLPNPTNTTNANTTTTPTLSTTTTPPSSLQSIGLIQTADGRLFTKAKSDVDQDKTDQAVVQYRTFFVPANRTSEQRGSI